MSVPHGGDKFEGGGATLRPYKSMFQPVTELLAWNDMNAPASSYPNTYSAWKEDAEQVFDAVMKEGAISPEEDASSEVARQIAFGVMEKFLQRGQAVGWAAQPPEARRADVERILTLPQVPQRTQAWYLQGKQVLTASEFASIFGSPRAVRQLAFQKVLPAETATPQQTNRLACQTCEMGPFDWGIRFEPVVKQILGQLWGATIVDSGRLLHPTDPLLAASPDGLITEATDPARIGRLLEIKCPITREINNTIPFEYWCQMQIQMEVTGIDECEYVEVKIESNTKTTDLSGCMPDGFVWLFQDKKTDVMRYTYTEAECDTVADTHILIEAIPWRTKQIFAKTVVRDRGWFDSTAQAREEFWRIVAQARAGEIQPFEVKKKTVVNVIREGCMITD